jgi:hypothetical protein
VTAHSGREPQCCMIGLIGAVHMQVTDTVIVDWVCLHRRLPSQLRLCLQVRCASIIFCDGFAVVCLCFISMLTTSAAQHTNGNCTSTEQLVLGSVAWQWGG